MMNLSEGFSLKQRVLLYQKTGEGIDRIIQELSPRIYHYPLSKSIADEDDAGEFYLFFLPKLRRLLLHYRDRGIPFEHYLNATLFWNLRSYFRTMRKKQSRRKIVSAPDVWDDLLPMLWSEESVQDGEWEMGQRIEVMTDPVRRRRYLFLLLRNAFFLGDREIHIFSSVIGYGPDWLAERVANLRETLKGRIERLRLLRCRRNEAYSRVLIAEGELGQEMDSEEIKRLRRRVERLKRIMRQAVNDIARIPLHPTHRAIAEELGIPKGTVDTGLRWIKKKMPALCLRGSLYSGGSLGYASGHGITPGHEQPTQTGRV